MKKLLMLIILVTLKLTSFSQKDTTQPAIKCFPIPLVKTIIKDLISGDSAKALLKVTEKELDSTTKKCYLKDSVIGTYKEKVEAFNTTIKYEQEKYDTLKKYTNSLEIDLKKEKVKTKLLRWSNYGVLLVLGIVAYILK